VDGASIKFSEVSVPKAAIQTRSSARGENGASMKLGAFRKPKAAVKGDSEFAAFNQRLDQLTAQLDRIGRLTASGLDCATPSEETTAQRLAQAIARLDQRLDRLIPGEGHHARAETGRHPAATNRIDQAEAEIAARQEVEAVPPAPRPAEYASAQGSAQDLTGFDQQLRQITAQMQTLQRPCALDDAVVVLRSELAAIGRTLAEAEPRRALEALEGEVRALNERIDARRPSAADVSAIAGLERGLAEVRDTLRSLAPAESWSGFHEAVQGYRARSISLPPPAKTPARRRSSSPRFSGCAASYRRWPRRMR
jgi:localization factor PodJL